MKYRVNFQNNFSLSPTRDIECNGLYYEGEWLVFKNGVREVFILSARSCPIVELLPDET